MLLNPFVVTLVVEQKNRWMKTLEYSFIDEIPKKFGPNLQFNVGIMMKKLMMAREIWVF